MSRGAVAAPSEHPHRRDVECKLDRVPDKHPARLEHPIPNKTEIGAVELPAQRERDPLAAVRMDAAAAKLAVERDRARDALDRQLTRNKEAPVVAVELDLVRLKGDLGVALDIEEIGRAEVLVTP